MGGVAGSAPRRAAFVLSPLQRQILDVVGWLPEAARFALAGGAALILRGTVERGTNDLDFFIGAREMPPEAIHRVVEATGTALAAVGLAVPATRCRRPSRA